MIAIIEITSACNLSCQHCYIAGRGADLTLADLLRGVETLRDDFQDFRFVGGEPLTVPDRLEAVIGKVRSWGKRVSITTNGVLVPVLRARIATWGLSSACLSSTGWRPPMIFSASGPVVSAGLARRRPCCGISGFGCKYLAVSRG